MAIPPPPPYLPPPPPGMSYDEKGQLTGKLKEKYPRPERPEFDSILNNQGLLQSQYQIRPGGSVYADTRGLEAIRQQALQQGPSVWLKMAEQQQRLGEKAQMDRMGARRQAGLAEAMDAAAARGGLSGGASERMGMQSQLQSALGSQDILQRGAEQRGQLRLADEENRLNLLSRLPGMEEAAAAGRRTERDYTTGLQQYNLENALRERAQKRLADYGYYKEDIGAWAAKRTADATRAAAKDEGGGLCFITTAACEIMGLKDDSKFLNTFRRFRDNWLIENEDGAELVAEYKEIAPIIVERIGKNREVYTDLIVDYLVPAHEAIKNGDNMDAKNLYKSMVEDLKEIYLKEGDK